jgi:hypothetical protein
MKNNYHRNIGSVSHATMRPEDLIPAFLDTLESQKPLRRKHRKLARQVKQNIDQTEDYFDSDDASFDLDELFDALDSYALPYFYFGAHPGDGSDYGFWLTENLENDFEGLQVNDLADVPKAFSGEVLVINDHGNTSLYSYSRGRAREVWAVV